jgi:hypothetical protein
MVYPLRKTFYNPRAISGLAYRCTGIGSGCLGDRPPNPLTWGTIASPSPPPNGSVAEPRERGGHGGKEHRIVIQHRSRRCHWLNGAVNQPFRGVWGS